MNATKGISIILAAILLLGGVPMKAQAAQRQGAEVIYLEDGSYIEKYIAESYLSSASGTKSGASTYDYHGANGALIWTAKLYGTFTYNGVSATCTASSCDVTIYDSNWYVVSKTAGKNGNKATASVTMGLWHLGVTVSKTTYSLSLTCDKNGVLS